MATEETKGEKYAQKIALLLAKAESTTPQEAELLIEKAQELMVQYAISEAMIDAARGVEREEIVQETITYTGTFRQATSGIGWAVLRSNECRGVYVDDSRDRQYVLYVAGFQSDVARTKLLDTSLQIQCSRALNEWWRTFDGAGWMDRNQKFAARREFIFGFASGLKTKLEAATKAGRDAAAEDEAARTGQSQSEASESVELVLRSRKDRVDDWMDEKYGSSLRSVNKSYKRGSMQARGAGHHAGLRADTGTSSLRNQKGIAA